MRTPRWLALLALGVPATLAIPAGAAVHAADPWPQYQGGASHAGTTPAGTPEPPYAVSWRAETGIGDPSQVLGVPAPVLTGDLAIVLGRETVDAVDVASGASAWSVPRALGPSAPMAVDGDTLVFVEGGGDAAASGTPSTSASSTSASTSASAPSSPSAPAPSDVSTLVGMSVETQERLWSVPLTDASHTGVVVTGGAAFVGADDGTITGVDLRDGTERWTEDIGDHVLAPLAGSEDLVLATVRPETQGVAALVALHVSDGSQAWRYEPSGAVLDLGGPSMGSDAAGSPNVYVVGSDASVRAVSADDGSQRWATGLYSPTSGSPPAIAGDAVVVADQSGTVYSLDAATGAERWRFATNLPAISPPVVTVGSVVQPASDGTVSAIDLTSGHRVWHGSIADSAVLGFAGSPGQLVASVTGTSPGLVGLATDASGVAEDVSSPTASDPTALVVNWLAAAVPLTIVFFLIGRVLATRMGAPELGPADEDDLVDPWEAEDRS